MNIQLLGMNHRTAPIEVREHFAVADPAPLLQKLVSCDEIEEAVLLSTCNRVDLIVTTHQVEAARLRMERFFRSDLGGDEILSPRQSLDDISYWYGDREAMRHVFRVSAAIDSLVVGEAQILGQVKDAYRLAVEAGTCGPILARLFQHAFATAKRVNNETRISQRPTSVARVAVELAKQIFESLEGKKALLVGAGEMIEMALFALQREGLDRQMVANRTRAHAEEFAARFNATPHGLDEIDDLLPDCDIVLTSIGGDQPLLSRERVQEALRPRRSRPIFIIDLGVPRNVAHAVNDLDSVYLYDIDDLQDIAATNTEQRRRESRLGEQIVMEEQQRFDGWLVALRAVPTIRHLRARAEEIQASELERQLGRLDLSENQRRGVELATRAIVNKILHAPLTRLRSETDRVEGLAMLEAARELFALDDPKAPGAQADAELTAMIEDFDPSGLEDSEEDE